MNTCLFCCIIAREIPSKVEFEDDLVLVFQDIHPIAVHHLLIVSKKHLTDVRQAAKEDEVLLGRMVRVSQIVARNLKFLDEGFQLLIRNGERAGQEVMHLHMHVISGRKF